MVAQAKKDGSVHVVVDLFNVTLAQIAADPATMRARVAEKTRLLVAELGQEVWVGGKHESPLGQVSFSVTEAGLKLLAGSGNALTFRMGEPWQSRTSLSDMDGSLDQIERSLSLKGSADVEVFVNVDGLEFDQTADGKLKFAMDQLKVNAAAAYGRAILESIESVGAVEKQNAASEFEAKVARGGGDFTPSVSLTITRRGLESLIGNPMVRALKVPGMPLMGAMKVDAAGMAAVEKDGYADVTVNIRNPLGGGKQSKESFAATARSNKRALEGVLKEAGVASPMKDMSVVGAFAGRITVGELRALQNSKDARLFSVQLNRPVATASLNDSTAAGSTNIIHAWNSGFRGLGANGVRQNIVVIDTGVKRDHSFLQKSTGGSKVVFEACFGTNNALGEDGSTRYDSVCPNQVGTTGDSPIDGLPGRAAPVANCVSPTGGQTGKCHHGTHVSGIAAGRRVAGTPAGLQGVANEADIVAIQAYSFDRARIKEPLIFQQDLEAALTALASAMTAGTTNNPYTVNISAGGKSMVQPTSCPWLSTAAQTAITTLYGLGVPVIASTGNDGLRSGVSFPSCLKNVIKVGAVANYGYGTQITGTNLGDPLNYNGDYFWMAPGYGVTSASNTSATSFIKMGGTSQAAPHVAGLYALVKAGIPGVSVIDISRWMEQRAPSALDPMNAAEELAPFDLLSKSVKFRRIKLKNF